MSSEICNNLNSWAFQDGKKILAKYATKWTLAHEVGHVLGLKHVEEEDRLMIPCTKYIKTDPPLLVLEEIQQMQQSGLAPEC